MENLDKYYTPLDKDLQQLAVMDWPLFVQLVGEDCIKAAKVCILKRRGKSYNQIATSLHTTKHVVIYKAKSCEPCKLEK